MSRKRILIILLAVGFIVSPFVLWALMSAPAIISAQDAAPCTNCLWLPIISGQNGSTALADPTATPTPFIVPPPDPGDPPVVPVPTIENPTITKQSVVWTLDGATVVADGFSGTMGASPGFPGGSMTDGFVVQANAISNQPDAAFSGVLEMTISTFSPAVDYGEQKAGVWYVRGVWTITRSGAEAATLNVRHNPDVLSGKIQAELPYNPAVARENWTGLINLPMSQAAGRWARGTGTLSLDAQLNGYLALDANIWPELQ